MARVIILNGVSSTGKSTLAKAIQVQADQTFLHIAMDQFIAMLPPGVEAKEDWFPVEMISYEAEQLPRITNGDAGRSLLYVMRTLVKVLARRGMNVVVDDVCHADEIRDYRERLADSPPLVVKVTAPLPVIEARESARRDRLIGLAREQSSHLHADIDYDCVVDTDQQSTVECAAQILALMQKGSSGAL